MRSKRSQNHILWKNKHAPLSEQWVKSASRKSINHHTGREVSLIRINLQNILSYRTLENSLVIKQRGGKHSALPRNLNEQKTSLHSHQFGTFSHTFYAYHLATVAPFAALKRLCDFIKRKLNRWYEKALFKLRIPQ